MSYEDDYEDDDIDIEDIEEDEDSLIPSPVEVNVLRERKHIAVRILAARTPSEQGDHRADEGRRAVRRARTGRAHGRGGEHRRRGAVPRPRTGLKGSDEAEAAEAVPAVRAVLGARAREGDDL